MNLLKLIVIYVFILFLGFEYAYALENKYLSNNKPYYLNLEKDVWEFGGEALYLQQKYIDYVPNRIKTLHDWGFELLGRYKKSDGRFIYVNWYHYKDVKNNLTMPISDFQNEGPIVLNYDYHSKFNFLMLEIGGDFYASDLFKIDVHAGLFMSRTDLRQNLFFVSNTTGSRENPTFEIRYYGIGPVLGLDIYYNIYDLFQAYITSEIPMMIRRGYYNSSAISVDINQVTNVAVNKVNVKGAMEGLFFEVGALYNMQTISKNIQLRAGWSSIHMNEFETQWSGPFFGAKWIGDL